MRPTLGWSPPPRKIGRQLATLIQEAIRRALKYRKPVPTIVVEDARADPESISVSDDIKSDGSTITFRMSVGLTTETPKGRSLTYVEIPVSLSGERGRVVRTPGYNRSYPNNIRPTEAKLVPGPAKIVALEQEVYRQIFKSYGESLVLDDMLVLSRLDNKRIDHFIAGFEGNAANVAGSCSRMLYFSAIVITTVGFGDIVPITPFARGLVATEAVLGIILAGFFLNAVAHRASKGPSDRPDAK